MKTYGYCRVSTKEQSIKRQRDNIKKAYPEIDDRNIFEESFTGRKVEGRQELARLLKKVRPGDQIIFDSVSRMSRDAAEGFELYMRLYDQGVELHFLKEPQIDTTVYRAALEKKINTDSITISGDQAADKMLRSVLAAIDEYFREVARQQIFRSFEASQKEVDDLSQRTREGMNAAREKAIEEGRVNDSKPGRRAGTGTGYNLRKYEKVKGTITRLARDFQGQNTDEQVMKITGLARGTYYSYKGRITEELRAEQAEALKAAMAGGKV